MRRLLIVMPREHGDDLHARLEILAGFDWQRNIDIFPLEPRSPALATRLRAHCEAEHIGALIMPDRLQLPTKVMEESGYLVLGGAVSELVHDERLAVYLRRLELDWFSQTFARLQHYSPEITERDARGWLRQFDVLGDYGPIGEHLFQLIDVVPLREIGNALCDGAAFHGSSLLIGFNQDGWGKSGAVMSNLVRRNAPASAVMPVTAAIEKAAAEGGRSVRWVEDGLFSATEMASLIRCLLGQQRAGHVQKIDALSDPALLRRVDVQLYYAVLSDFGSERIHDILGGYGLANVQVVSSGPSRKLCVLRREAGDQAAIDALDGGFMGALRSRVMPYAFQQGRGWKTDARRDAAQRLCEEIGSQLWRHYLEKKASGNPDWRPWPEWRVNWCSLGMERLGLTIAFPHSVPKATLPIFWGTGEVTLNRRTVKWKPLFPNADT